MVDLAKLEKELTPEEALLEIKHRAELGRLYKVGIQIARFHALKESSRRLKKPGESIIPFSDLDADPNKVKVYAESVFREHLPSIEEVLGVKYDILDKDRSTQDCVAYALFSKTRDTIHADVARAGSNYPVVYQTQIGKHLEEIESELPILATQHVSDKQLPQLAKYLKLELDPTVYALPHQLRRVIYEAALKHIPLTTKEDTGKIGKVHEFPASPLERKIASAQEDLAADLQEGNTKAYRGNEAYKEPKAA